MFDRITFDPRILGGRASIRGMRIPVSLIVSQVAHGATWVQVLQDYPDLEREDIGQALVRGVADPGRRGAGVEAANPS